MLEIYNIEAKKCEKCDHYVFRWNWNGDEYVCPYCGAVRPNYIKSG